MPYPPTPYQISEETLNSLMELCANTNHQLNWNCLFMLPEWMKPWSESFGKGQPGRFFVVRRRQVPIGVAPLLVDGNTARLVGGSGVCDYLDCITAPQEEREFFRILLDHLRRMGITSLDLGPVRPDSSVVTHLVQEADSLSCRSICSEEDVSFEMALPPTWDDYLHRLNGKQRHEIRRKIRRLEESGEINFRVLDKVSTVNAAMETFLELMRASRPDKNEFMNGEMAFFFRKLTAAMADRKMAHLEFLELDGRQVAGVLCFDYRSTVFLYNSGFDPRFRALSVGLLSKVLSIRTAIENGRKAYNFLKGSEIYKHRLGGRPLPIYRCRVELTR